MAGEINTHGTDAFPEPATADSEMVRRLREAGAIVVGLTLLPELAICGFTESATYGVTRNPWNPQRTPGGSSGGSRRGGRRRPGPDRLGRRRRRLDPHPRRLLRPLRPEAPARPGLAGARPRSTGTGSSVDGCVSRTVLDTALWLDIVAGGSRGAGRAAAAGAALRRVGEDAARQAAGRLLDRCRRAPRRRRPSPTSSRARSPTPPSCCARSATRSPSATPTGATIGNNITPRFLRGVAETSPKCRTPSGSNAAPAASAGSARCSPTALFEQALARPRGRRRPRQRDLRLLRRPDDAGDGRHGAAGAPLGGPAARCAPCSG